MLKNILIAAASSMLAVSAFALESIDIEKSIALKDGSTVHIFRDGNMGMESAYGRAVRMDPGSVMETKDGQKVTMRGDEVARVDGIIAAKTW